MSEYLYVIAVTDSMGDRIRYEILDPEWRLPDMLASQFAYECNEKYAARGRYYQPIKAREMEAWLAQ